MRKEKIIYSLFVVSFGGDLMKECERCTALHGWIILIVGVLFLLVDFGIWSFWGIQWWTALFILVGLSYVCKSGYCPTCKVKSKKR